MKKHLLAGGALEKILSSTDKGKFTQLTVHFQEFKDIYFLYYLALSTSLIATDLPRYSKRKRLIKQTLPQNNNPGNGPIWLIFLILLCWILNYAVLNRTNTY